MIRFIIAVTLAAATAMSIALAQLSPAKVILLVGPPGSGKTTQAKVLAKRYGIPAISMSDLLKKQISSRKDAVSKALAVPIASGDLMPDDAAADLVKQAILNVDHGQGFILDGFPNTAGQAKALDRILQDQQLPKAVVVVLDVPDDVIRKRMIARRRVDDKPEIIERRIGEFRKEASLLVGWAGQTHVVRVNADAKVGEVSAQIVSGLENAWSQHALKQRQ